MLSRPPATHSCASTRSQPDIGSCSGSTALVGCQACRLKFGQGQGSCGCAHLTAMKPNGAGGRHTEQSGINQPSPACDVLDRQTQELDRSSRGLHLQLIGQLADFRGRITPVATQRLQKRELAFLGPAGHGLGRHVQDVGHLRGPQVGRGSGAALPLDRTATAHPFRAVDPIAVSVRIGAVLSGHHSRRSTAARRLARLLSAGRTGRSCRSTPTACYSPIGLFQRLCYIVHGAALTRAALGKFASCTAMTTATETSICH
jgi:hypothetical protein